MRGAKKEADWKCYDFQTCFSQKKTMGGKRWMCECDTCLCSLCHTEGALEGETRFAYVAILFGKKVSYVLEAAVLGFTLRKHGARWPLVLLHTPDVPRPYLTHLQGVGWEPMQVQKIMDGDAMYDGSNNNRFAGVFYEVARLKSHEI